jgi:integrase
VGDPRLLDGRLETQPLVKPAVQGGVQIPYFGEIRLDAITFDTVERYIAAKLGEEDALSARSINMTRTLLATILERARKRRLIEQNHARDRDLRVREHAPRRTYLDSAVQIEALLSAAGVLCVAGLRIGELLALRWRDVDLGGGWLTVGEAKTDAGRRRIKVRGALRDELSAVRSRVSGSPDGYVFPTRTGKRLSPENFRARVLAASVKRADERLVKAEEPPRPDGLTPHSLRRTFCSLLYALREDQKLEISSRDQLASALRED